MNEWNSIGSAKVYYLSPMDVAAKQIALLVRQINPDGVFLNSIFSRPSIMFLWARRRKLFGRVPVMLAPCGELSEGALSIKRTKKSLFLRVAKAIRLHRDITWKATTETEAVEIRRVFGQLIELATAPDLPPNQVIPEFSPDLKPKKVLGTATLIYYSRIDRKKNIKYLLEVLREAVSNATLIIAGPVDDKEYWSECVDPIREMPNNIKVEIKGALTYEEGLQLLTTSHFFVLPTLGENLGYVILEALAAGCPVILSDKTIWDSVSEAGGGWSIPLTDPNRWVSVIRECAQMDADCYRRMSDRARKFAVEWINDPKIEELNSLALEKAFGKSGPKHRNP
jgi:glycosyltransferase involved in cell wall biosynthesis